VPAGVDGVTAAGFPIASVVGATTVVADEVPVPVPLGVVLAAAGAVALTTGGTGAGAVAAEGGGAAGATTAGVVTGADVAAGAADAAGEPAGDAADGVAAVLDGAGDVAGAGDATDAEDEAGEPSGLGAGAGPGAGAMIGDNGAPDVGVGLSVLPAPRISVSRRSTSAKRPCQSVEPLTLPSIAAGASARFAVPCARYAFSSSPNCCRSAATSFLASRFSDASGTASSCDLA
jgi:hypothetical protein